MTSEKTAWAQASSAGYGCWRVLCWRVLCWSGTTKVAQGKVTTSIRKLSSAHTMEERSAGEVLQREGTRLQPKAGRRHTVVRVRTGISLGARAQRIEAARDCSGSRLCGRRYLSMAQGTPLYIFSGEQFPFAAIHCEALYRAGKRAAQAALACRFRTNGDGSKKHPQGSLSLQIRETREAGAHGDRVCGTKSRGHHTC